MEKDELDLSCWWTCSDITYVHYDYRMEANGSGVGYGDYWRLQSRFEDAKNISGEFRFETFGIV